MRTVARACGLVLVVFVIAILAGRGRADTIWVKPPLTPTPVPGTPIPEPTPDFGRVIYRAAKVASLESLGVTMVACRHRDPTPRRFALQFFDRLGRKIQAINEETSPAVAAGKKVVFVTDGMHFRNRSDVQNLRMGHLAIGGARVVSDASVVHCVGKIRMDAGANAPSYRDEIGLVRAGEPLPVLVERWVVPRPTPGPH
jgi:hypothetical protein